jgi:hypothetical protein
MIKEAIEKILSLAPIQQLEISGRTFTSQPVSEIKPALPASLQVHTLTGLADYLTKNPDKLDIAQLLVHVVDPENVRVVSRLAEVYQTREPYANAVLKTTSYPFDRYLPVDQFIIALQTYFVPCEMVSGLLKIVGNLAADASVKYLDDGVTQQVTARTGITRLENIEVPNPVDLAPYRTFLEVNQPISKFVFRIKQDNVAPTCALFAADGGNWQLEAIRNVKQWLAEHIPQGTVLLA